MPVWINVPCLSAVDQVKKEMRISRSDLLLAKPYWLVVLESFPYCSKIIFLISFKILSGISISNDSNIKPITLWVNEIMYLALRFAYWKFLIWFWKAAWHSKKNTDFFFSSQRSGFKSQLYYLHTRWAWTSYLTFLSLCFLVYRILILWRLGIIHEKILGCYLSYNSSKSKNLPKVVNNGWIISSGGSKKYRY